MRLKDGKWEELLTNIEDKEFGRKALKRRKLPAKETDKLTWTPMNLVKPYLIEKGTYRFYVAFSTGENDKEAYLSAIAKNIGSEVGEQNPQLIFSDAFELK